MNPSNSKQGLKSHAIQLDSIVVHELFIRPKKAPDVELAAESDQFSLSIGTTEYNSDKKTIIVGLKMEVGEEPDSPAPFNMRIELAGKFQVDENQFSIDNIDDWAKRNAMFILYPYLREHAYSLSQKCGFSPMILPLLEVPTAAK